MTRPDEDVSFDIQRDLAAARPGQRRAISTVVERVRNGENTTSIVLPTRYGKSDVARLASGILVWSGDISGAMALEPNVLMRQQIADASEWNELWGRYGLIGRSINYRQVLGLELDYASNGEQFLAMTMQLFQRNVDLMARWIESRARTTGRRLLLFVDECHFLAGATGGRGGNAWAEAIGVAMEAGAHVVELTATPYRSDNRVLPGFATLGRGFLNVLTPPNRFRCSNFSVER
jgi:superfamily II DNA or RNA helicase